METLQDSGKECPINPTFLGWKIDRHLAICQSFLGYSKVMLHNFKLYTHGRSGRDMLSVSTALCLPMI